MRGGGGGGEEWGGPNIWNNISVGKWKGLHPGAITGEGSNIGFTVLHYVLFKRPSTMLLFFFAREKVSPR